MKWQQIALLLLGSSVHAVELREVSFDEKVSRATVVVIGVVEQTQPHENNFRQEFAQVKVESVLKGTAPDTIRLETYGRVAEEAVIVTAGRRYIFLLRSTQDVHISVNGKFGVIPVDGKPVAP
jgi:hypothetical protein